MAWGQFAELPPGIMAYSLGDGCAVDARLRWDLPIKMNPPHSSMEFDNLKRNRHLSSKTK